MGGSVICEEDSLYEVESNEEMFGRPRPIYRFVAKNLDPFRNRPYQAVIASDQTFGERTGIGQLCIGPVPPTQRDCRCHGRRWVL